MKIKLKNESLNRKTRIICILDLRLRSILTLNNIYKDKPKILSFLFPLNIIHLNTKKTQRLSSIFIFI